jgi:hypothetical protein
VRRAARGSGSADCALAHPLTAATTGSIHTIDLILIESPLSVGIYAANEYNRPPAITAAAPARFNWREDLA